MQNAYYPIYKIYHDTFAHPIETKYGTKNKKSGTQQNWIELNQICRSIFQNDEDKIISSYDFQRHSFGAIVIFLKKVANTDKL